MEESDERIRCCWGEEGLRCLGGGDIRCLGESDVGARFWQMSDGEEAWINAGVSLVLALIQSDSCFVGQDRLDTENDINVSDPLQRRC